jgi:hypothetical protein
MDRNYSSSPQCSLIWKGFIHPHPNPLPSREREIKARVFHRERKMTEQV